MFTYFCSKFTQEIMYQIHRNRTSFVEDITKKTFWSVFFLDTLYKSFILQISVNYQREAQKSVSI